jgi:hypothetical protein
MKILLPNETIKYELVQRVVTKILWNFDFTSALWQKTKVPILRDSIKYPGIFENA